MKNIIITIIVLISLLSFKSSENKSNIDFPGTIFIKNNLYFDKHEISNIDWKEYMYWQKRINGEYSLEYKNTIPDSTVWDGKFYYFKDTYFNHPKFNNYPVVGIRYDQAVAFCKWRTERVKDILEAQKKKNKKLQIPDFEYRLPTKAEWLFVANVGFNDKTLKEISKAVKKDSSKDPNKFTVINSRNAFWPNNYGVYSTQRNVSEYVLEKGIVMGGNFTLPNDKLLVEQKVSSVQREKWLGFRCVCIVK